MKVYSLCIFAILSFHDAQAALCPTEQFTPYSDLSISPPSRYPTLDVSPNGHTEDALRLQFYLEGALGEPSITMGARLVSIYENRDKRDFVYSTILNRENGVDGYQLTHYEREIGKNFVDHLILELTPILLNAGYTKCPAIYTDGYWANLLVESQTYGPMQAEVFVPPKGSEADAVVDFGKRLVDYTQKKTDEAGLVHTRLVTPNPDPANRFGPSWPRQTKELSARMTSRLMDQFQSLPLSMLYTLASPIDGQAPEERIQINADEAYTTEFIEMATPIRDVASKSIELQFTDTASAIRTSAAHWITADKQSCPELAVHQKQLLSMSLAQWNGEEIALPKEGHAYSGYVYSFLFASKNLNSLSYIAHSPNNPIVQKLTELKKYLLVCGKDSITRGASQSQLPTH